MRSRRPSPAHQEAVSRRLALLGAELAAVRAAAPAEEPEVDDPDPATGSEWWEDHTRVRPSPWAETPSVDQPDAGLAVIPVPGRHAARRRGRIADAVPPTLRGRVALGAPQVAVLAVLVALGLGVTCWWIVRGDATGVATAPVAAPAGSGVALVPLPDEAPASGAANAPGTPPASGEPTTLTVDVAGKVRRPGIAVLPAGSRVVDALEAAGGARPGVDLSSLNLARLLVDGEQVLVGAPVPAGVAPSALATAAPGAPPAALVNLNTATAEQLESLPEVGPVTAQAILAWRDQHGGFTAVDELLEVDGIGEVTLAQIAPHVTV
ncbi:ComEA family DNA-binding protein [Nocardioides ferulae]|uniref:ComEA family DNA-binding protein n=1 Tax=Nocardioides ferulae TaxID=2340821 RepID=UPI00197EE2BC|nr:ComEA family DNA-binding protein [Nocardioides ferulae]